MRQSNKHSGTSRPTDWRTSCLFWGCDHQPQHNIRTQLLTNTMCSMAMNASNWRLLMSTHICK